MAGNEKAFQEAMNQGHSAAWDQLWDRAAAFYRQALEEFPNQPQALVNLGLALIELQEFEEALRCYTKAARVSQDDPLPMEKIAQLYERLGNLDRAAEAASHTAELYLKNHDVKKAVESWERVTRLQPEDLKAHSRLAMAYERMGDKDRSAREYLATASLLQEAGEVEKAISTIHRALQAAPESTEVTQALALLRESKPLPKPKRAHGATAPLRMSQVRQLQEPKDRPSGEGVDPIAQGCQNALMALAGVLFETADIEQEDETGPQSLQKIVTGSGVARKPMDHTRVLLHLSQVIDLQARGEDDQAADELQRAVDIGLENPAAAYDLGYLYLRTGHPDQAIGQLQAAVNHPDYALGAHLMLGEIYRQKGQTRESSVEYLEALKLADCQTVPSSQADDLRQLYEPLVETYRQHSDPNAQSRLADNIHELLMRPDWLVHVNRARGQLSDAAAAETDLPRPLAEMLTEAGSNQLISALAAIHQMKHAGRLRSAMEESYYALELAPTYLPLHTFMADLLVEMGEDQQAVEKYLMVARVYSMRGEASQAIALYRKIIELSPADSKTRLRLVEELLACGQVEEAVSEYIQLAEVYISLADLPMARKTYTDALRAAQSSKTDRETRIMILKRIADIDMQSLDWRQAVRIHEQIRTLQPEDQDTRRRLIDLNYSLVQEPQALNELRDYLGYLETNAHLEQAGPFLEELLNEHPERLPIRRLLADWYRRQGHTEEAISQLDTIGDMLLSAGDRAGAIEAVRMILQFDPPNKSEYQQLLDQLKLGKV
jgi:tetratricopeptide (TPR) repeat protein